MCLWNTSTKPVYKGVVNFEILSFAQFFLGSVTVTVTTSDNRASSEGMGAEEKRKKNNYSWYSAQGPGRMAQTPQAGTGDSVS